MRINKLAPEIYNKISAGEVVERPASIVKELVENSIDAGAKNITIKISGGGIKLIEITDDGSGIHFDDLKTAFLPHATSKIQSSSDLEGISTLGFRGEALASIAAVSEVELISKQREAEEAGRIKISGGEVILDPVVCGFGFGTKMRVENLFFNVPARAKFLKKPKSEELEITNLVTRLILANPCIAIKYIVDDKVKYISTGKGMEDALFVVYGKEAITNSIYFEEDYGYIKLYGYIGKPSYSKPNRTYQTIIINNRVISNQTIVGAVQNAYGELLMKKQYPFFVLYVDLDYTKVDVNVHPNKHEVRFENSQDIYLKVFGCVNRRINMVDYTNKISVPEEKEETSKNTYTYQETESDVVIEENIKKEPKVSQPETIIEEPKQEEFQVEAKPEKQINLMSDVYPSGLDFVPVSKEQEKANRNIFASMNILNAGKSELQDGIRIGSRLLEEMQQVYNKERKKEEERYLNQVKVLGVLFKTYIVAEVNDTMLLIDQHAGHERILYDKYLNEVLSTKMNIQTLIVPYIFNVNYIEEEIISALLPDLYELGFEIEKFGESDYRVNAVPYMFIDMNIKTFIDSILTEGGALKKLTIKDMLQNKIATLACKAAVKAGDYLTQSETEKLITDFKENGTKLLCPHGRPIVVQIDKKELEKWFKRIV